jgi:hypothetical protein
MRLGVILQDNSVHMGLLMMAVGASSSRAGVSYRLMSMPAILSSKDMPR